jgi:hypothetical protein
MDWRLLEERSRPVVAGVILLLTLVVLLGGAIRDPRPHDVPVGLSVPPYMAEQLVAGFEQAAPGAFSFTNYASEADARAAIGRQEIVGALVAPDGAPRLIVAQAAGEAVSGGVTAAFTRAFEAQGRELMVETVHPSQMATPMASCSSSSCWPRCSPPSWPGQRSCLRHAPHRGQSRRRSSSPTHFRPASLVPGRLTGWWAVMARGCCR